MRSYRQMNGQTDRHGKFDSSVDADLKYIYFNAVSVVAERALRSPVNHLLFQFPNIFRMKFFLNSYLKQTRCIKIQLLERTHMDRRNYFTHNFASRNKVMLHTLTHIPLHIHTHTQYQTHTQLKPLHILIASAKNIFNFNRLTSCCCCCCCFIFISIYQEKAKRVKIVRQKGQMQMENAEKRPKEEQQQQQQLGNKPFTLLPGSNGYTYSIYIHTYVHVCTYPCAYMCMCAVNGYVYACVCAF